MCTKLKNIYNSVFFAESFMLIHIPFVSFLNLELKLECAAIILRRYAMANYSGSKYHDLITRE